MEANRNEMTETRENDTHLLHLQNTPLQNDGNVDIEINGMYLNEIETLTIEKLNSYRIRMLRFLLDLYLTSSRVESSLPTTIHLYRMRSSHL